MKPTDGGAIRMLWEGLELLALGILTLAAVPLFLALDAIEALRCRGGRKG